MKIKNIIHQRKYSDNPGDRYLSIVFCEINNKVTPYATWLYNSEDGGYYEGHYFYDDEYEKALRDYLIRI